MEYAPGTRTRSLIVKLAIPPDVLAAILTNPMPSYRNVFSDSDDDTRTARSMDIEIQARRGQGSPNAPAAVSVETGTHAEGRRTGSPEYYESIEQPPLDFGDVVLKEAGADRDRKSRHYMYHSHDSDLHQLQFLRCQHRQYRLLPEVHSF